jgi:hypothetical protein
VRLHRRRPRPSEARARRGVRRSHEDARLRPPRHDVHTFDFAQALSKDHASPHAEDFSGNPALVAIDGAWSNVKDMRRYVQMELAKGKLPDGKRFVSEGDAARAPRPADRDWSR